MTIRELRILPPLAVGRLGEAESPMDNYDAEVDDDRPLDFRRLQPTETFRVDPDKIDATVGPFSDHARHPLLGTSPNFWPDKRLPLGWVQYIRPADDHPEIRLRFTPAHGNVYGSSATAPPAGEPADGNIVDV